MKSNNLYRIIPEGKTLKAIREIEFSDFNFKERYDIQEWVESTPSILGEDLLIISKDLTFFNDTKERPDLIALDKNGNIVIIELKRDDSGFSMEWQAIKYASYLSKFKTTDILNLYEKYLTHYKSDVEINPSTLKQKILEFIDEDTFDEINKSQRLILVSHRFAKEVISAVNWLIEKYSIGIQCVQLIPFYDKDKDSHYIQASTILPVVGIEGLLIGASNKNYSNSNTMASIKKDDEITDVCNEIFQSLKNDLGEKLPDKKSRWAGDAGTFRYFHMWYLKTYWDNWGLSYRIWIYINKKDNNKVGIALCYHPNVLLNNGLDESNLLALENFIKTFDNRNGFKLIDKNVQKGIEKYIKYDKAEMFNTLKELINMTVDKVNEVLNT